MEKNKIQSFQQKPAIEKLVAGFLFSDKKEGKEMNEKELKEKGWVEDLCEYKTKKCSKRFCNAQFKNVLPKATKEEIEEAKEMVNCPFYLKEVKEMKKTMETPNGQWREVEIDENRKTFICIDCEAKTDIKELCRPHEDSLMEYCPHCYYLED